MLLYITISYCIAIISSMKQTRVRTPLLHYNIMMYDILLYIFKLNHGLFIVRLVIGIIAEIL